MRASSFRRSWLSYFFRIPAPPFLKPTGPYGVGTHEFLWIDQKRASKVRGTIVEMSSFNEPVGEDGRKTVDRRLTLARVLAVMETLPAEQRAVLALVCVEELSYQETATLLEIPIGTVMSRLSRARRFLHAKAIEGPATLEADHGSGSG